MNPMTVEQLYDKLCSKSFQDTENGDLFYNFYLYLYPCDKEYRMREQIAAIKESIKRPRNNVDVLTLDISRASLQEINLLAQQLNEDPLVDFCTVTTAATNDWCNSLDDISCMYTCCYSII